MKQICKFCKNNLFYLVSEFNQEWFYCLPCNLQVVFTLNHLPRYLIFTTINKSYACEESQWIYELPSPKIITKSNNLVLSDATKYIFTSNVPLNITPSNIKQKISTILTFL